MLDTSEQIWFERCSVFVGGWTLAAAEALHEQLRWPGHVATNALDALSALVDKSLVQVSVSATGETRFSMLETIREFADERLRERGAFAATAQAHADALLELIEPWDVYAPTWIATIERDLENLRAALRWYLSQPTTAGSSLRLGAIFARFWYWRDFISEGCTWLERIIVHTHMERSEPRADLLNWAALFANTSGNTARGTALFETSLNLARELALLKPRANALLALGTMYARQADFPRAIASLEESLLVAQHLEAPTALSNAYYMLANILIDEGSDIARAGGLYETCLSIAREHGMQVVESMALACLGEVAALTGEIARAEVLLPEALQLQRDLKATMAIGWTLLYLGVLRFQQARYHEAGRYLVESLEMAPQGGAQYIVPVALEGVAGIRSAQAQPQQAAQLLGAAEALRESIDLRRPPIERTLYQQILASVQRQLTDDALDAAWNTGRTLTIEQAIAEAKTITATYSSHPRP